MVQSISSIILIPLSWKIESVREQSTRGSWVYYGTMTQNPQDWEDRLPGDLCSRQVTGMKKPAAPVSYDPWFSLWRWYDSCWIKGINMQPAWAARKSRKKEHTPSLLSHVDVINWDLLGSTAHFVKMRCLRLLISIETYVRTLKLNRTIHLASGTSSSGIWPRLSGHRQIWHRVLTAADVIWKWHD